MIKFIVNIVQSIIIAMIFIIIIEMLLPNNSNKKYVKMVAGIYMIFTIINPFLKLMNKDIDVDFFENLEIAETSSSISNEQLKQYYISSFKIAIKSNLEENGYKFSDIEIDLNDDYTEITSIKIKGVNLNDIENIKKFLIENYGIDSKNIFF